MLESLFIPAASRDSRRLMVVLHGLGDTLDSFRSLPSEINLPWLNYLLVNDHNGKLISWPDSQPETLRRFDHDIGKQ